MTRLLWWEGGKLFLDTQMSERTFAKTTIAKNWREEGLLAEVVDGRWVCRPWSFEATVSSLDLEFAREGGERVFLAGECFPFSSLADVLGVGSGDEGERGEDAPPTHAAQVSAAIAFSNAADAAAGRDDTCALVANLGAGGTLLSREADKVLFLPKTIFCTTAASLGERAFCAYQGWWVNPVLQGRAALDFTKAVLLYRVISGELPFAAQSDHKRREDVLDLNYKPLRYVRPCVDEAILSFTEKAFGAKGAPGDLPFPQEELAVFDFDTPPSAGELEQFQQAAASYFAAKRKRVSSKRWLRSKSLAVKVTLCALVLAAWFAASLWQNAQDKPTTKGLNAVETLQMHYSAINLLDTDSARASSARSLAKRSENLGNIYVTGRMSSMFNPNLDTLSPAVWFASKKPSHNIWGLSCVTIDGQAADLFFEGPRKKDAPPAVSEAEGSQVQFLLDYCVLDTSGEDRLTATHQSERVTLRFHKGRWRVSHIESAGEPSVVSLPFSQLKADYESSLREVEGDVFACAASLRQTYSFISTDAEIRQAQAYLERQPQ